MLILGNVLIVDFKDAPLKDIKIFSPEVYGSILKACLFTSFI